MQKDRSCPGPLSLFPQPQVQGQEEGPAVLDTVPTPAHLPAPCPPPPGSVLSRAWAALGSLPSLVPSGALCLGLRAHIAFPWGQSPGSCPGPALTAPPSSSSSLSSASSTLCPPPSPQLYLQARAPPEGDSDLATRLLTEPDVQKVPPWDRPAQALTSLGTHPLRLPL